MRRALVLFSLTALFLAGCTSGPKKARPFLAKEKQALLQEYEYAEAGKKEQAGDLLGAVEILRRIQATSPQRPEPYLDLCRILIQLQWLPQVEEILALAKANRIVEPRLVLYKAKLAMRMNQPEVALELLESATDAEHLSGLYLNAVAACQLLQRPKDAITWARKGAHEAPSREIYECLAGLEWMQGNAARGVANYERALKLEPEAEGILEAAALCAVDAEMIPEALDYFERLERLGPLRPSIQLTVAEAYKKTGNTGEALRRFAKAARGGVEQAWLSQGNLHLQLAEYPQAEQAFRRYLVFDQSSEIAIYGIARALVAQGRSQEAVGIVEDTDPKGSFLLSCVLGDAKTKLGDYGGAVRAYREASLLQPDAEYPREVLEQLGLDER